MRVWGFALAGGVCLTEEAFAKTENLQRKPQARARGALVEALSALAVRDARSSFPAVATVRRANRYGKCRRMGASLPFEAAMTPPRWWETPPRGP